MKKKSRFLVVLFSPLPGLSHLYLGWNQRAFVFFTIFVGLIMAAALGSNIGMGTDFMAPVAGIAMILLWFLALAEALSLARTGIDTTGDNNEELEQHLRASGQFFISSRKLFAVALSVIPGAGHMFLGLLKQGAQLMGIFFITLVTVGWLDLKLLVFILPVIWFYSLFDIYHILEEEEEGLRPDASVLFDWFSTHPHWLGWGLVILGILIILARIVGPALEHYLTPELRNYAETSVVALILIAGGVKLLMGNKTQNGEDEDK